MSISEKLNQLLVQKENLATVLRNNDVTVPESYTFSTLIPIVSNTLLNRDIEKFIAKGLYNDDIIFTISNEHLLTITGTAVVNSCSSNNPLYYLADFVKDVNIVGVQGLGDHMFGTAQLFKNLETISLDNNLISIGNYCFDKCEKLKEITIPKTVTTLGNRAFRYCYSLEQVLFESGTTITNIYDDTFYDCNKLQNIILPNSIVSIGSQAFMNCNSLLDTNLFPNSLTTIGSQAFMNCTSLLNLSFPDTITTINNQAFNGCTSLVSADLSLTKIKTLNNSMFYGCTSLTNIKLPSHKDFYSLQGSSIYGCTGLTTIEIPNHVRIIYGSVLAYCTNLSNIKLSDNLYLLDASVFSHDTSLTFINLPNKLNTINNYAFEYTGLESISIPESVININTYTFRNCTNLREVIIKARILNIGTYVFRSCTSLEYVEIPDTVTTIHTSAFNGCTQSNLVINIHNEENSISGAPWGATNATINWLGLPDKTNVKQTIPDDFTFIDNLTHYFDFTKGITTSPLANAVEDGPELEIQPGFWQADNALGLYGNATSHAKTSITSFETKTLYVIYKKQTIGGESTISEHIFGTGYKWSGTQGIAMYTGGGGYYPAFSTNSTSVMYNNNYTDYEDFIIVTFVSINGTCSVYVNGNYINKTTVTETDKYTDLGLARTCCSGDTSYARYRQLPVYFRALLIYNEAHDNEQMMDIVNYLKAKFIDAYHETEEEGE